MDGIYARQSLDKKESISIETQIAKCRNCIDDAPHKVYTDKGFSGKNTDRPDFQRLMKDIKSGLITRVVVYKIDRISRSIVDFGGIMDTFNKYNVEFVSVNEKFDTSTPIGKAMLYIIMVFAQLERETIQQRTKDNFYARGANAFGMSGIAPYGYKKVPVIHMGKRTHTYEPDADTASVVKMVYDMYANEDDATLFNIATRLTDDATIARTFTHTFISRLLKNPFYVKGNADIYNYLNAKGVTMTNEVDDYLGEKGVYLYGDRSGISKGQFSDEAFAVCNATVALHDGLVDAKTWLKCQHKLAEKNAAKNIGRNNNPNVKKTWLIGIMKCKYCGKSICARAGKNRENIYVTCRGRIEHVCYDRTTPYKIESVEKHVEKELLAFLKKRADVKANAGNTEDTKMNRLKIELTKLDEQIANLIDALASSNSSSAKYINEQIAKLDDEKNQRIIEMSEITAKQAKSSLDDIDIIEILEDWQDFDVEDKKQIAKATIEKIIISNEGIDIIFY